MIIELLFKNRKLVGENILSIIRDNGYTKSSFSRLTTISRTTLDRLINGEVNNLSTFRIHINKILKTQDMDAEQLLHYVPRSREKKEFIFGTFFDNVKENRALNSLTQEMFGILEDIIHMYELYYGKKSNYVGVNQLR